MRLLITASVLTMVCSSAGAWDFWSSKDRMTDETSYFAHHADITKKSMSIMMVCNRKNKEGRIYLLGNKADFFGANWVTLRFDTKKATDPIRMLPTDSHKGVTTPFYEDYRYIRPEMVTSSRMLVRIIGASSRPAEAEFDLRNSSDLRKYLTQCGWI